MDYVNESASLIFTPTISSILKQIYCSLTVDVNNHEKHFLLLSKKENDNLTDIP